MFKKTRAAWDRLIQALHRAAAALERWADELEADAPQPAAQDNGKAKPAARAAAGR